MVKGVKQRKRKIGQYRYKAKRNYKKGLEHKTQDVLMNSLKKELKKEFWDKKKSAKENCSELGIIYNLNKSMPPKSLKDEDENNSKKLQPHKKKKTQFVKKLEEKCEEMGRSINNNLRMPPRTVDFLTYLLDSYGEDYKAMARDGRNYDQETWKQLRAKIKKFKSCTDQYAQYLKRRNLLDSNPQ